MLSLLTYHASAYVNAGQEPSRRGNAHPSIHPFQPYECLDGYLTICVGNDRLFSALAEALGHPEWSEDIRFITNAARVCHREELDLLIQPIFLRKTRSEWRDIPKTHGVPAKYCGDHS